MANNWSHNTTFEEVVQLLEQDESYRRTFGLPLNNETTRVASESASSATTTPGLLDTAFLNETNADDQHGQISLSAAQSQTTKDAALTVYRLIDNLVEQQPAMSQLGSGTKTMVSTGTMPMTPVKMTSFGTMARTPPRTASIGTAPTTPSRLPATTTTSVSVTDREIIDLCSPTVSIIDLVSPSTPTNADTPQ